MARTEHVSRPVCRSGLSVKLKISGQMAGNPQGVYIAKHVLLSIMNKSILIIDDDQPIRLALRRLLESHAFDCEETDDGLKALTLLDRGLSVGAILSDYHMPVINGVNFLKALSYRVSGDGIPVILLSGNMTKKMEQIAKQAGAFAVMAKPYDPQKLLATVSQACNRPIS